MKEKNYDEGPGYYYVTATFTEWLPLALQASARRQLCDALGATLGALDAILTAYVLMPDHVHLLVKLEKEGQLDQFLRLWCGRCEHKLLLELKNQGQSALLDVLRKRAKGSHTYAVWEEQARALRVYGDPLVEQKVAYIHANPVRRGLVETEQSWLWSSARCYETGEPGLLPVTPLKVLSLGLD